jgi:hypothetical protein
MGQIMAGEFDKLSRQEKSQYLEGQYQRLNAEINRLEEIEKAKMALLLQIAKTLNKQLIHSERFNRFDEGLAIQRRINDLEMLIGQQSRDG